MSGVGKLECEVTDTTDVFFVETVMQDDARVRAWEHEHGDRS